MSTQSTNSSQKSNAHEILARQGLRLPMLMLKQLRAAGIYCQPSVSVEHQHIAKRYVLRGVESGGAVNNLGAYSSFVGEDGAPLAWLQRVESVGVNGVHAVVIAQILIRLEMIRVQRTYDLLITRHTLNSKNGIRPQLQSEVLFFGRRGTLEMEIWGADANYRGTVAPIFYNRSGEQSRLPKRFQRWVALITGAVSCIGCGHCHLLRPDATMQDSTLRVGSSLDGPGSAA